MAEPQLLAPATDLPPSPINGLELLLTLKQLREWTGYSEKTVYNYRMREEDPLPQIGPDAAPRFLPSEVLAWMRREAARTSNDQ